MTSIPGFPQVSLPKGLELREWQIKFLTAFLSKCISGIVRNFLLEAGPGSGKTIALLSLAYILRKLGLIDWIIIVVPGEHLRNQVARDAHKFGLDLYHTTGCFPIQEYQGEVITYAQVAANPNVYATRCSGFNSRLIVIGDEIHHVGDKNSWGESFQTAFQNAGYRLFTSGTPFRSDNQKMVGEWIKYVEDESGNYISVPDYRYGYAEGVRDKIVRHVIFSAYEGEQQWLLDGDISSKSFGETTTKKELSCALTTALMPNGDGLKEMLTQANHKLRQIRSEEQVDAGGILFCISIFDAKSCAKVLESITGVYPIVVTNDDKESSDKIAKFGSAKGASAPAWIVSIKMVSEGVNIPRLRVGVFGSNIMTELYFRQAIGRIIRVIDKDKNETAFFYFFAHPTLIKYAMAIKEERCHFLPAEKEEDKADKKMEKSTGSNNENGCGESESVNNDKSVFLPISSSAYEDSQLFDGEQFTQEDLTLARQYQLSFGLNEPDVKIAAMLRDVRKITSSNNQPVNVNNEPHTVSDLPSPQTKTERVMALRELNHKRACSLAYLRKVEPVIIHNEWISLGGKPHNEATEDELIRKLQWVEEQIKGLRTATN